jgi:DNA repair protein RadA/Sms
VSKGKSVFRCTECGADQPKWGGRCESCGVWNSLVEEAVGRIGGSGDRKAPSGHPPIRLSELKSDTLDRWRTGLAEFDFVLGGGIVPGSVTLVGGEPGIGKSTLLMQCAARLESQGVSTLYVSGEESPDQLRLRADRLEEDAGGIHVLGETRLESILHHATQLKSRVVLVDSVQTTYTEDLEGAPGNVGQVRECAARLMRFAKESGGGPAVLLVGHVTKGGGIAGPKTLEHIVDTVLYFEGETTLDHRILRAVKNRFGSVDEIGVFRMTGSGLEPVANPAAAFLAGRSTGASGSAVTARMEGTRPMLVEIQALASKAGFGTPQRVATGLDHRRLALLLAVLERRGGLPFGNLDVFVNVTGGVRLIEPSTDLAVLAALVSTVHDRPVPADALFLGEVGLGGEIRPVAGVERRLAEAARQGFRRVFLSSRSRGAGGDLEVIGLEGIGELTRRLAA